MRRVAVKTAYTGDSFFGSQIQPGLRTVEGDILTDLMTITPHDADWFDLKCASRTDRGVNALGNVVVFNTEFSDNSTLIKALNAVSKDIFYRSVTDVETTFNPRHASERIYRYILPATGIDIEKAEACSKLFIGEHDFIRFCRSDSKPTVTEIRSITMKNKDDMMIIEFRAGHFLWNMIRRIVAAISSVGKGDSDADDVKNALNGAECFFGLARPDALTLVDVLYDNLIFEECDPKTFEKRITEEQFKIVIKNDFIESLRK